ncbi:hypothetical protein BEWA_004380 [Theileria equi strain WA]|uniref:Uncharacterized protein n=1 Tax=Theileria equi strain WA TaxID=1537102 RepID=L0AZN9_THEEQ|nr:hypothetical protein BEWA_004380 [Theileria equi strain WA]AFZ81030.1 hypothetical protein BEWA_004380 [Theileria equi strain WA]|eukprot:XP_004830696.1 hypothetical protein BEWA_004380 [Theileria equi strain WA]
MAEDGVTIDFSQNKKPPNGGDTTYPGYSTGTGKNITIKVTSANEPKDSNFWKYEHRLETGNQPFKLSRVWDDRSNPIPGIPPNESDNKVTSVSAYYWRYEPGGTPAKALVAEVVYSGNKTYYRNSSGGGKNWILLTGDKSSHPPLLYGDIERALDDLVCEYYGAVTMNLFKVVSVNLSSKVSTGNNKYCCAFHSPNGGGEGKVSVNRGTVPAGSKDIEYYKHFIDNGTKLAGIKTNSGLPRKRITALGLDFPIQGSLTIYAFYCNQRSSPVLIYVKDGNPPVNKWFRQIAGDTWQNVPDISKDPENIKSCSDEGFKALVKELRDFGCNYSTCKEPVQSSPQQAAGGSVGSKGGATGTVNTEEAGNSLPAEEIKVEIGTQGQPTPGTAQYTVDAQQQTDTPNATAEAPGPSDASDDKDAKAAADPGQPIGSSADGGELTPTGDTDEGAGAKGVPEGPAKPKGGQNTDVTSTDSRLSSAQQGVGPDGKMEPATGLEEPAPKAPEGDSGTASAQRQGDSSHWEVPTGIFGGVFTVSGLVGFIGFKFYRSHNGDPWVKHRHPIEYLKNVSY